VPDTARTHRSAGTTRVRGNPAMEKEIEAGSRLEGGYAQGPGKLLELPGLGGKGAAQKTKQLKAEKFSGSVSESA